MQIDILDDAVGAARRAATCIAAAARQAIAARGRFPCAVSGGRTPEAMLRVLAADPEVDWTRWTMLQVDERVAPAGDAARNLTHLYECLGDAAKRAVRPMPVERTDMEEGAAEYAALLRSVSGSGALDLVHLGLGADGHTASLVPDDPLLERIDADVGVSVPYAGFRRMTLTLRAIDRAREIVWLVTGADKAEALQRLADGERTLPAGRVSRAHKRVIADRGAANRLGTPHA